MEHLNSLHLLAGDRVPLVENTESRKETSHKETTKAPLCLTACIKELYKKSPVTVILIDIT